MIKQSKISVSEKMFKVFNYMFLSGFCLLVILPFLNILALSLNNGQDATAGGVHFWPRMFTWENYTEVLSNKAMGNAYLVTVSRTVLGTFLSVLMTGMAAYALKCKTLPGRSKIMMLLFFTTLFNGGVIPYYLLLRNLQLTKSFLIFIIPSLYSVWNIIIMRSFFETINSAVEESARIDGCNDFQIFFQIILPISKPVISVIALFNGVGHWNDWFTGAFFVRDNNLLPLQTLLQKMLLDNEALLQMLRQGSYAAAHNTTRGITTQSLQMAMVIICTLPIMLVYPFIQKYFVQGVMIGSVKG